MIGGYYEERCEACLKAVEQDGWALEYIDRVAVVAEHVQLPLRRHVDEE